MEKEQIKEYLKEFIKKEHKKYGESEILSYSELNGKCHYEYMIENTKGIACYIFFSNISILVDDKSNNTYSVIIYLCHKQNGSCDLKTGTEFYIGGKFKIIDNFHFNIGIKLINKY